jgi:hypothetical protein
MKKTLYLSVAILIVFSAVAAFAADVTGAWSGEAKGPNGESFQLTFNFKQDGGKLTGTVTGPQGYPLDITDGKVDGDKIAFNVSFNGMTISHNGVIKAEEIALKTKTDQGDAPGGEMTLKRSK